MNTPRIIMGCTGEAEQEECTPKRVVLCITFTICIVLTLIASAVMFFMVGVLTKRGCDSISVSPALRCGTQMTMYALLGVGCLILSVCGCCCLPICVCPNYPCGDSSSDGGGHYVPYTSVEMGEKRKDSLTEYFEERARNPTPAFVYKTSGAICNRCANGNIGPCCLCRGTGILQ